jgi:hypothetical protein
MVKTTAKRLCARTLIGIIALTPPEHRESNEKTFNFLLSLSLSRRPAVINAPINEPPLPRRKKCPELAYRHHEFIVDSNADRTDSSVTRARVSRSFL